MKKIVEIQALNNGSHRNQIYHGNLPEGWAIIPENLDCKNFPFGKIETKKINNLETVINWIPEDNFLTELIKDSPNIENDILNMLIDQEYRLSLLELKLQTQ